MSKLLPNVFCEVKMTFDHQILTLRESKSFSDKFEVFVKLCVHSNKKVVQRTSAFSHGCQHCRDIKTGLQ